MKEIVQLILSRDGQMKINGLDSNGNTALHVAAQVDNLPLITLLLSLKANPNLHNGLGETPLLIAILAGHAPAVKQLLDAGANSEFIDWEIRGQSLSPEMTETLYHQNIDYRPPDSDPHVPNLRVLSRLVKVTEQAVAHSNRAVTSGLILGSSLESSERLSIVPFEEASVSPSEEETLALKYWRECFGRANSQHKCSPFQVDRRGLRYLFERLNIPLQEAEFGLLYRNLTVQFNREELTFSQLLEVFGTAWRLFYSEKAQTQSEIQDSLSALSSPRRSLGFAIEKNSNGNSPASPGRRSTPTSPKRSISAKETKLRKSATHSPSEGAPLSPTKPKAVPSIELRLSDDMDQDRADSKSARRLRKTRKSSRNSSSRSSPVAPLVLDTDTEKSERCAVGPSLSDEPAAESVASKHFARLFDSILAIEGCEEATGEIISKYFQDSSCTPLLTQNVIPTIMQSSLLSALTKESFCEFFLSQQGSVQVMEVIHRAQEALASYLDEAQVRTHLFLPF